MPARVVETTGPRPPSFGKDPVLEDCPEPIAIVGMGCRFPGGASEPSKLWDLLINGRSGVTDFPASRANIDGFYHPNKDRPGSLYSRGGCFINEDLWDFDHGFFGITPLETMSMDPTQRKLLETAYEAFENGGETLESLSGSRTGVYVGNILFENYMMQLRDADFTLPYITTGASQTILSNRVNYVFNLKGPSFSLDTACSSSMYALHLAVNAIRNNDCDAALVAGTQLTLGPDFQISVAKLGVLSPTSTCHTFDAAADGYSRSEGFGTLYLKRVSDAVKNGDPIRAVIRGTAANTNGRTAGIAHPSPEGQEDVIRSAYRNAGGLDPNLTGYFECHGTGTQVGDPLEVNAIGKVFASGRKLEDPLLIGSIKTNIGHGEAASGVAGVMKAVLAIENGVIPPTIGLVNPNPNIDFKGAKVKVVTAPTTWPSNIPIRRASVNSFGFGGANAHVVLDHVSSVLPDYSAVARSKLQNLTGEAVEKALAIETRSNGSNYANGTSNGQQSPNEPVNGHTNGFAKHAGPPKGSREVELVHQPSCGTRRKVLLPFSARDETSLKGNITAISSILSNYELSDLTYTLSCRRTRFAQRAFTVLNSESKTLDTDSIASGLADSETQRIGFIFTGQGAQWPGMALELYKQFEVFRRSIRYHNSILSKLHDGPSWIIEDVLLEPPETSSIHEPQFAQTLCSSIQFALVDLLESWGIRSYVSIGHSSGEIAAAYASGYLTAAEGIAVAYYRGKAVEMNQKEGRMLAVGLGAKEVYPYLQDIGEQARIACYNSPQSVTISGDTDTVLEIKDRLNQKKVFNRELKTGNNGYHSHHMKALGQTYEDMGTEGFKDISADIDLERKYSARAKTIWISSVDPNKQMTNNSCGMSYWRQNLESPVQFMQAVEVASEIPSAQRSIFVEIGPHPALSGPFKQIRVKTGDKLGPSLASISRGSDNFEDMLKLAGNLFLQNTPIDLTRVNAVDVLKEQDWILAHGSTCVDLPRYCFNYSQNKVYYENRLSKEWRFRKHLRHDLLGARIQGCSKFRPSWRNILRAKDLGWFNEQRIHGETIFSPAGYLAMAVEATTQAYGDDEDVASIAGFSINDVEIVQLLKIPDNDFGVETIFDLRNKYPSKSPNNKTCFEFNISSVPADGDEWVDLCSGTVTVETATRPFVDMITIPKSSRSIEIDRWYERFTEVGVKLEPSFRGLSNLKARDGEYSAGANVNLKPTGTENGESKYIVHPATIEAIFQLGIISGHSGQTEKIQAPFTLNSIAQLTIWVNPTTMEQEFTALALARSVKNGKHLTSCAQLSSELGVPLIEVREIQFTQQDSPDSQPGFEPSPCFRLVWKPDATTMSNVAMRAKYPAPSKATDVGQMFDQLEEMATYSIIDIYEEQKHQFQLVRQDELQRFLNWIQRNVGYAKDSKLPYSSEALSMNPVQRKEKIRLLAAALKGVVEAELITAIHHNLSEILSGATSGLQVALENNLLAELYISGYSITYAYPQLINILDVIAHQNPRMDIIEVGGGTGGATREVLKALGGSNFKKYHSYTFTDVSSGFLPAVENECSSHKGMIYKTFDLEIDPADQGYEPKFDLVIGSQVLHTTSSILKSVQHARKLLKPGGKLLLLELTRVWLGAGIVLGTFPGYWNGNDDGRLDSPFVDLEGWQKLLTSSGFSGVDVSLDDHEYPYNLTSVIVATAIEPTPVIDQQLTQKPLIYLVYRHYIHPLGRELEKTLKSVYQPVYVRLSEVDRVIRPQSRIISLIDISNSSLYDCSPPEFEAIRSLISQACSLLWVYAGNPVEGFMPTSGILIGLVRSLVREFPQVKMATLGLEKSFVSSLGLVAQTIATQEQNLQGVEFGAASDHEYVFQDGTVLVSRLEPDKQLNTRYSEAQGDLLVAKERALDSVGAVSLIIDSEEDPEVYWQTNESFFSSLKEDWVEVKVKAISLNKNMATNQGKGFYEFSGIVYHTGKCVEHLNSGDRVFGMTVGSLGNFVRVPAVSLAKFGETMTFTKAATMPAAWTIGVHAAKRMNTQSQGTLSLVFGADSADGLLAAQWACSFSTGVLAIVEEENSINFIHDALNPAVNGVYYVSDNSLGEKLRIACENDRPPRVVLSFGDSNSLIQAAQLVNPGGLLIDVGGSASACFAQISSTLSKKGALFESFDITALMNGDGFGVRRLVDYNDEEWFEELDLSLHQTEAFDVSQIETALKQTLNAGSNKKVVVTFDDTLAMLKVKTIPASVSFDPNAMYILVGGFGGIGRSISTWMARHGARRLAFISRSGAIKPNASDLLEELSIIGVKTEVVQCNVVDKVALTSAIEHLSKDTAIKGIVHTAIIEGNATFEDASHDQLRNVLGPKVQGTINLHEATLHLPLELFIMISSAISTVGVATQGMTSAANAFQDSFARHRRHLGLPAQSVSLGPVLEMGSVEDLPAVKAALQHNGLCSTTEYELLRLIETTIACEGLGNDQKDDPLANAHLITGMEPHQLHKLQESHISKAATWHLDARFARLVTAIEDLDYTQTAKSEKASALDRLKDADPEEKKQIVSQALCERLAKLCYLAVESIDPRQAVNTYGVDSMIAAEFRSWLFKAFEVEVSFLELLSPSMKVTVLVNMVLEKGTGM